MSLQNSKLTAICLFAISLVGGLSCRKVEFNTTPILIFERADSYNVRQGDFLTFRLRVTDKEGDLQDSLFLSASTRRCPNNRITLGYRMPPFPTQANLEAEIVVRFVVNQFTGTAPIWSINLCPGAPDTANFKFWIKDLAQNVSDTVETDRPIIIQNN